MAQAQRKSTRAPAARPARQDPNLRRTIWPRRNQPGLALATFRDAMATAHRDIRTPTAPPKPDGLVGVIKAALRFCAAVGLPELWERPKNPDAKITTKAPTLLELEQSERGLVIRLIHRVAHSKHRLEEAAEAMSDLLSAIGRDVRFREIGHAPNLGGWQATLRIAPALGRTAAISMVR